MAPTPFVPPTAYTLRPPQHPKIPPSIEPELLERLAQVRDNHPGEEMVVAEWADRPSAAGGMAARLRKVKPLPGEWVYRGSKLAGSGSELVVRYVGPAPEPEVVGDPAPALEREAADG